MLEMFERMLAALIILLLLVLVMFIALPNPSPDVVTQLPKCPPNSSCPGTPSITSIPPDVKRTPTSPSFAFPSAINAEDLSIDGRIAHMIYIWSGILALYLIASIGGVEGALAVPGWKDLRGISQHDAFKLSYIGLFFIPVGIYVLQINVFELPIRFHVPTNVKLSYFSALSFAVSGIIYGVASPKELTENNASTDKSGLFWRWLCYFALMYGVLFIMMVFYRTSIFVFFAK